MAYTVDSAFLEFYQRINLSGDFRALAAIRRNHIVGLLGNRFDVIDGFAGGSIPKFTSLKTADLDIFVVLHFGKHCCNKPPSQVLLAVRQALNAKPSVRRNGQAVTLKYSSFPDVDVVPVFFTSHDGVRYDEALFLNVPDMNTETWIRSRPKDHVGAIDTQAAVCGPNFRKVIKILKHWNSLHGNLLRNYHIECVALQQLTSVDVAALPQAVFVFFRVLASAVLGPYSYDGDQVDNYLAVGERLTLYGKLVQARDAANTAWFMGMLGAGEQAINQWRSIFGNQFPSYG
ncbi:nucleotidyltransferase [Burkholderia cepacia]|uniref:nucleotidyltransferase domain-containing protein n=1 Tax=Burkholderia cepacia TaxID=292 RepID=UPI000A9BAF30|nr:nucleotidyltransferase [Burkholderia cepacia]